MFRVQFLIYATAVLWTSMVICQDCLYQDELWHAAGSDPTKFSYCDLRTNSSAVGSCPTGSGYVRNATASGCIPWSDWNDACINKTNTAIVICNEQNSKQPQPAIDPEYFFLCPKTNGTAVPLKCDEGKAFYSANKTIGCVEWGVWRNLTGCLK